MKRLLFVTYYFPPSGGPGVQRSLKFVKYLPEFGWKVTVLTVDPADAAYPDLDPGLEAEIPTGTAVIRTRARDPYAAYAKMMGVNKGTVVGVGFLSKHQTGFREKLARWIRANLFLPDARVGWTSFAKKAALDEVAAGDYHALLSTGPPHSAHLIAQAVKRETGLPWLLDLRDAWPPESFAHLLPMTDFARSLDGRKRDRAFSEANLLVAVSHVLGRDIGELSETPVEVVPNGFDEDDFRAVNPIKTAEFNIVYTGNLTAEQNPIALWQAIKKRKKTDDWEQIKVVLVGHVAGDVHASIEQAGLRQSVDVIPYVEHDEAIEYMSGADLLLLCINNVPNPDGIITGKLYEYLASGKPILCFSQTDGEAAGIVRETGAGKAFKYEDSDSVGREIDRHYSAWSKGSPETGAASESIGMYSRRSQAEKLAGLLNVLTIPTK